MSGPDSYKEEDSERDGVLSYAAEWHSFTHGVYYGLTSKALVTPPEPDNKDVEKEPHYYRGGYIVGTLLQLLIVIAMTYGVINGGFVV